MQTEPGAAQLAQEMGFEIDDPDRFGGEHWPTEEPPQEVTAEERERLRGVKHLSLDLPMRQVADATKRFYTGIVKALWTHTAFHMQLPLDVESILKVRPTEVLSYLWARARGDIEPRLTRASFNSYSSALIWHFRQRAHLPAYGEALAQMHLMEYPQEQAALQRRKRTRTKNVQRGIPVEDLEQIIESLMDRESRAVWGRRTALWLVAGVVTGLRPGEWEHAEWTDGTCAVLRVRTSKVKSDLPAFQWRSTLEAAEEEAAAAGAAPPDPQSVYEQARHRRLEVQASPYRFLPVEADDRPYVLAHMGEIRQALAEGYTFERYYGTCRKTLYRAGNALWGDDPARKRPSLYDTRHQFAANLRAWLKGQSKASGAGAGAGAGAGDEHEGSKLPLASIYMGHSSARTTARHYAPANRGWGAGKLLARGDANSEQSAQESVDRGATPRQAPRGS